MHITSTLLSLLLALSSYGVNLPEKKTGHEIYQNLLFAYSDTGGPLVFTNNAQGYPPTFTANTYVPAYNSGFGYGTNMGYYGANWNDDQIAGIFKDAGGSTLRVSLPEKFLRQWGYGVRVNTFKSYRDNLGLHDLTAMVEGPSDAVRDRTRYDGFSESNVFANLYQPIWNSDGSVNSNNYYANYIYNTVINYGDYIRFWEICNEPDFSPSTNTDNWYSRNPTAAELPNLKAPLSHYIRMLRIAYEVIKNYKPNDYVAIGGIGYDSFLDAVLRNTDNPADGSVNGDYPNKGGAYFDVLSYHYYPIYALRTWNNSIMNFDYQRHSDGAVNATLGHKALLEQTLKKYGYGSSYPQKHVIVTETNVGRKTTGSLYGGNEYQRNYVMKMMVQAQKNNIDQVDFFMAGETANYDQADNENQVMGFYENLYRDAPGSQKLTMAGIGHKTIGQLLYGYNYDNDLTNQLALPANVDGGAFKKGNDVLYVLYAKTTNDMNEWNTATYNFPSALNIKTLGTYEWNYSVTGQSNSLQGSSVQLSATPVVFKINETSDATKTATASNINYNYYELSYLPTQLPDFGSLTPTSSGKTSVVDLSVPHRSENYGISYRGYINIPETGNYTFETYSDDGSRFYIDGNLIVDNDGSHEMQMKQGTIYLSKGVYPFNANYIQGVGEAGLQLFWKNTANGVTDRQIIPRDFFVDGNNATILSVNSAPINYKYYELKEELWALPDFNQLSPSVSGKVSDLDLGIIKRTENFGLLYEGFINIPVTGNYTFETNSDDGSKFYIGNYDANGEAVVDNNGNHGMRLLENTVYLSSGIYPFALAYMQGVGPYGLEVYWKNTAHGVTSRQRIPKEYYVSGPATATSFTKLSVDKHSLAVNAISKQEKTALSYTTGVYPNPVSNTVFVKLGNEFAADTRVRLQLSDLSGHVLKTQNLTQANSSVEMDIQSLNLFTGMYFLKISGDGVPAKTFKVIKK